MAFLDFPLTIIIYARRLASKDTDVPAKFEENRELMLMAFPKPVTWFNGKTKVKGNLAWIFTFHGETTESIND